MCKYNAIYTNLKYKKKYNWSVNLSNKMSSLKVMNIKYRIRITLGLGVGKNMW